MWSDHFVFALRAPAPVPAHIVLPCSVVALNLNGSYQLTMYILRAFIFLNALTNRFSQHIFKTVTLH